MITWTYSNDANIGLSQRQQAKQSFLDHLGKFKDEFEANDGFVNIIFKTPPDDHVSFTFNFSDEGKRHDFMIRFNEWVEAGRPE